MYAVIMTGGKQYRVKEGDLLEIERLNAEKGQKIKFDKVLLIEDSDQVLVGTPIIEGAAVKAEVMENFKSEKVLIFKKKRRKQYRRTKGHRQELSKVRIEKIFPEGKLAPEEEFEVAKTAKAPAAAAVKKKGKAPRKEVPAEKKIRTKTGAKAPAKEKAAPKKKASAKPAAKAKKKVKE